MLYMAHPFGDRLRLRDVEHEIEAKTGLKLVNPFYDVEGRLDVRKFDAISKDKKFRDREERQKWISSFGLKSNIPSEIVERDLNAIRNSDGTLAFFTDKISVGTPMEVFFTAHEMHKPVFLVIEDRAKMGHPWLTYFASGIFTSAEEFINSFRLSRGVT